MMEHEHMHRASSAPSRERKKLESPDLAQNKNKKDDLWKRAEWLAVILFICCACVAAAGAVVVSVFAVKLVDTISEQTRVYVESTSASVAGPISSFCETLQPVVMNLCSDIADALTIPRTPTAEEVATYGFWNYTRPDCPGCKAFATLGNWGGPAQVLFLAQNHNATELQDIVELYFWRLGGLAPMMKNIETAWVDVIQQVYFTGRNGYSMIYPFFPLFVVQLMNFSPEPPVTPDSRGFFWVGPYIDQVTRTWVSSFYVDLYDSRIPNKLTGAVGRCGVDAFVTQIVSQVEKMTETLSNGAYVVLSAYDGTLMMIPESGSADWVSGEDASYRADDGTFNYTEILSTPNYNLTEWNIFANARYAHIAAAIQPTLAAYEDGETYIATIDFATGKRFISWCFVPRSMWIVISVIDEEEATADERHAMVLMVCLSTVLGVTMVVAAGAVGAYSAVTRKYAGLTAKISDLNTELEEMKGQSQNLGQIREDMAAVGALTSGMKEIAETLRNIAEHPDKPITEEQIQLLQNARQLLLSRDFKGVKTTTTLNSDQKQFVHDCGIEMDHTGTSSMMDTLVRSHATPGGALATDDIMNVPKTAVGDWRFNVFQVAEAVGTDNLLQSVVYSALTEQNVLSSGLPLNVNHLLKFVQHLEMDYCSSSDPIKTTASKAPRVENPYHNKYHAADVTQAFHSLLLRAEESSSWFRKSLTPLERLACIVAAAAHDYKHPGRNNVFLHNTLHPTYITFVESSLERSHAAFSLTALFLDPDFQPLAAMSRQQKTEFHSLVAKLIYATDMAKHVELVDALKAWVPPDGTEDPEGRDKAGVVASTPPGKLLILQLLLKAADISNAYREWEVCQKWTFNLMKEFAQQGAEEKEKGLQTSKFMDGRANALEMQNSFVPLFVIPLLKALTLLFPNFLDLEKIAWANLAHWRELPTPGRGTPAVTPSLPPSASRTTNTN